MEVTEKRQNGVIILVPKGRLDSNTSDDFEKRLLGLVGAGETSVVIDFKDLDYISSAGLRVLLKTAKELKRTNGQFSLCSIKDYIREKIRDGKFLIKVAKATGPDARTVADGGGLGLPSTSAVTALRYGK